MISYYELLGMIKEDKAPNKIRVHLASKPLIYKKDDDTEEYCFYVLEDKEEENGDYKYYLMESYIESMMFDETIEIIEEDKRIEKLDTDCLILGGKEMNKEFARKINEIIDYLQSKGE